MEEIVDVGEFKVIRNPTDLADGDEVISFRNKTVDTVKKGRDGRFMLSKATEQFNWPVHFKQEYYGKIIKN